MSNLWKYFSHFLSRTLVKRIMTWILPLIGPVFIYINIIYECQVADARPFYYEFQGGISQIRSGSAFFGDGTPGIFGFGAAAQLGLFTPITSQASRLPFEVQFGLQGRYQAVTSGVTYSLLAPYPTLRIQLSILYIGAGIAPVVYATTRTESTLQRKSALGVLGETGFLWSITPEFSMGAIAAAEIFRVSGVLSPKPVIDFTVLMRFYIQLFGHSMATKKSIEWHGWRYPFGEIR